MDLVHPGSEADMEAMECRNCGKVFVPQTNAQKHCSVKCRRQYNKLKAKVRYKTYACSWCGIVFEAEQRRKYCTKECRLLANNRLKKRKKKNVNVGIVEVTRLANEAGLTYGQYVAKYGL